MMNLLNYTVKRHIELEKVKQLPNEEAELAQKINNYFKETKPLHRKDVLDYFGISKHMFYKLKNANAIHVPLYMTNKQVRVHKNKY